MPLSNFLFALSTLAAKALAVASSYPKSFKYATFKSLPYFFRYAFTYSRPFDEMRTEVSKSGEYIDFRIVYYTDPDIFRLFQPFRLIQ